MASKRSSKKKKSGCLGYSFLLILVLASAGAAGYLYYENMMLKKQLEKKHSRNEVLEKRLSDLKKEMKQKEEDLAEMHIQAVIKDSEE